MLPYIDTESGFQTLVENKSYPVNKSHPKFDLLFKAVCDGDSKLFLNNYSVENNVNNSFTGTGVVVKDGVVYYKGKELHNALTDRIVSFSERGLDHKPMVKFLENLMKNPSSRAVNELYSFLAHKHLPITEDGCFLAYKSVRSDFKDKYSGKFDNSPGQVVKLERNEVDDDKQKTCSYGLHVGALEYSGPGGQYYAPGDKVVIVKVNPVDAVSVPADHNATKLRVCCYEVLSEYVNELDDDYTPSTRQSNDEHYYDEEQNQDNYQDYDYDDDDYENECYDDED